MFLSSTIISFSLGPCCSQFSKHNVADKLEHEACVPKKNSGHYCSAVFSSVCNNHRKRKKRVDKHSSALRLGALCKIQCYSSKLPGGNQRCLYHDRDFLQHDNKTAQEWTSALSLVQRFHQCAISQSVHSRKTCV
jgi:hypothetical protein